ncbi:MAG TPA: DUF4040 domain-containing protein [Oscillatoriaceae cyanobacterium M33_DOE_052]|uniref:DUF4040 domain-containing protein n=1 Tax=Planktothricoides sp. SpSt-374 TaxID=2282167 RepID=A0A7C3VKH4_9CYAN|nr:DUF4040 domain-containing protein [Oscillatoriaceae cyanobacterium M33_DOE_052]
MTDFYIYLIIFLMPLVAGMLLLQSNPYYAMIMRGILGALAALTYSILGAADVALTEALVGTLLAITLYAVAVRSSMVMRLGIIKDQSLDENPQLGHLLDKLRAITGKWYLRLELVNYEDAQTLHQALIDKEIHAICVKSQSQLVGESTASNEEQPLYYETITRIKRLYEIMQNQLPSVRMVTDYQPLAIVPDSAEQHQ